MKYAVGSVRKSALIFFLSCGLMWCVVDGAVASAQSPVQPPTVAPPTQATPPSQANPPTATTLPTAPTQANKPAASTPPTPQFDNRIFAEFDKLAHVKRVKVGDPVTAHLTAPAKLRDGAELPKGSKLMGTVTEVKVKADKEGPSKLGLLFTTVVMKDGKQMPLRMALVTVAPHGQLNDVDLLSAGNPFSGGNRMQAGSGANTLNNVSNEGEALSRGLGARAPASKTAVAEGQMRPGKSYLPDIVMASFSAANPGTILTSTAGSVYLDSGYRLLLLQVP